MNSVRNYGEYNSTMDAQYVGKHGSLGYKKDKVYTLIWSLQPNGVIYVYPITKRDMLCPYGSLTAFKRNWRVVSGEEELSMAEERLRERVQESLHLKGNIYILEDLNLQMHTASGSWLQTQPYKAPIAKVVEEHFDNRDGSMSYKLQLTDGYGFSVGKDFLEKQTKIEDAFKGGK